jgi:dihydroflavonol-4-reductase
MILVTGANGFLGSHLVRQLVQQGQQVKAIHRPSSNLNLVKDVQHKMEWVEGDILDYDSLEAAMKGVEQVYHCAAIVTFDKAKHKQMMQVNVEGTANVVNACLASSIKKLCYASSVAALGRVENGGTPITEQCC